MGIDAIDIVMGLENEFGIEIPDEARELKSVGELSAYIADQVPHRPPTEIWTAVQRIVANRLNVPTADVQPGSRWIEDLLVN